MKGIYLIIGLWIAINARCVADDAPQNDAALVAGAFALGEVSKGSNYQVELRNLYHLLQHRYTGMAIADFEKRSSAWGWEREGPKFEGVARFIHYDLRTTGYTPSKRYPHKLYLEVFVDDDGSIKDATPYLQIELNISYKKLLNVGYDPTSVLGRLIRLDNFKRKANRAGKVETISLTYANFRYVSSATEAGVFTIDVYLPAKRKQDSGHLKYHVTSGLDYISQQGEPPPADFKGVNTLIESPFQWEKITEKDGQSVFYCPRDEFHSR